VEEGFFFKALFVVINEWCACNCHAEIAFFSWMIL
jgi:hypothetical protein